MKWMLLLLLSTSAWAGDKPSQLIAGEQACIFDWQKYCSEYGFDYAAIHACFIAHENKVSPACMALVRRYRGAE